MLAFRTMGVFFWFAATCAFYAAITLTFPGTPLDRLWDVNPTGHAGLLPLGRVMGLPFLLLAVVAATLGRGWWQHRRYAWYGAVIGIGVNMLGDLGQACLGRWREGLVGVVAAGLVLIYLALPGTRRHFPAP